MRKTMTPLISESPGLGNIGPRELLFYFDNTKYTFKLMAHAAGPSTGPSTRIACALFREVDICE